MVFLWCRKTRGTLGKHYDIGARLESQTAGLRSGILGDSEPRRRDRPSWCPLLGHHWRCTADQYRGCQNGARQGCLGAYLLLIHVHRYSFTSHAAGLARQDARARLLGASLFLVEASGKAGAVSSKMLASAKLDLRNPAPGCAGRRREKCPCGCASSIPPRLASATERAERLVTATEGQWTWRTLPHCSMVGRAGGSCRSTYR